jgi:hypothetical protein
MASRDRRQPQDRPEACAFARTVRQGEGMTLDAPKTLDDRFLADSKRCGHLAGAPDLPTTVLTLAVTGLGGEPHAVDGRPAPRLYGPTSTAR